MNTKARLNVILGEMRGKEFNKWFPPYFRLSSNTFLLYPSCQPSQVHFVELPLASASGRELSTFSALADSLANCVH